MDPICLNEAGEKSMLGKPPDLDQLDYSHDNKGHNGDTFPKMFLSQKSGHFSWCLMVS